MNAGGIRVHVLSAGKGEPVLLLHGLGASSFSWRHVLPELGKSCQVYAPDWPGFGRSEQPRDFEYSVDGLRAWLGSFMDSLGLKRAALAGNSMGGMAALAFAMMLPERVSRLALLGTPVYTENRPKFLWPLRWPLVGTLFERFLGPMAVRTIASTAFVDKACVTDEMVAEYSLSLRTAGGRRAVAEFMRNAIPADAEGRIARYPSLQTPTLVIVGDQDGMVAVSSAERFARTVPKAELLVIPSCGHAPQEEKPAEVASALLKFLSA